MVDIIEGKQMDKKELEELKEMNILREAIRKNTRWRRIQQFILGIGAGLSIVILLYFMGN